MYVNRHVVVDNLLPSITVLETGGIDLPKNLCTISFAVSKGSVTCPGAVAQWASHPPQEKQTRVRFPLGYKVFREIIAMLLCVIDLICSVCVIRGRNKGIDPIIFLKRFLSYLLVLFTKIGSMCYQPSEIIIQQLCACSLPCSRISLIFKVTHGLSQFFGMNRSAYVEGTYICSVNYLTTKMYFLFFCFTN
jgi:hypothetical protein